MKQSIARMKQSIQIPKALRPTMLNEENVDRYVRSFIVHIVMLTLDGDPFCLITNWNANNDKVEKHFRSGLKCFFDKPTCGDVFMVIISNEEDKDLKIATGCGIAFEKTMKKLVLFPKL
jgi:hypothetical protein